MATEKKRTVTRKRTQKAEKPSRLYVSVSKTTLDRLDALAEKYGVTRASLISLILGQYCAATEEAYKAIPAALNGAAGASSAPAQQVQPQQLL